MWPALRTGDQVLFVRAGSGLSPGDIAVVRGRRGIVVHRVASVAEGEVSLRGDACSSNDPPLPTERVLGRVLAVRRSGRLVPPKKWLRPTRWRRLLALAANRLGRIGGQ